VSACFVAGEVLDTPLACQDWAHGTPVDLDPNLIREWTVEGGDETTSLKEVA
jgi:hypothetical protein